LRVPAGSKTAFMRYCKVGRSAVGPKVAATPVGPTWDAYSSSPRSTRQAVNGDASDGCR
jgi:hypothetical protein